MHRAFVIYLSLMDENLEANEDLPRDEYGGSNDYLAQCAPSQTPLAAHCQRVFGGHIS